MVKKDAETRERDGEEKAFLGPLVCGYYRREMGKRQGGDGSHVLSVLIFQLFGSSRGVKGDGGGVCTSLVVKDGVQSVDTTVTSRKWEGRQFR